MTAKGLEVQVEQAIVRDPLTLSADATVAEAIALMSANIQSCKFVCDTDTELSSQLDHAQNSCILVTQGKKLIGILTERDLIRLCSQHNSDHDHQSNHSLVKNLNETAIAEVMVYPVYSLLEWEFTDILVPLGRFQRYNIRHLPLVNDQGEVVGLLTHESLRQLLRPMDMLRLRRVKEAMTVNVICAYPTDSLGHITSLMSSQNISSVVIVERAQSGDLSNSESIDQDPSSQLLLNCLTKNLIPVGIITEGDIVQYLSLGLDLNNTLARAVMSYPLIKVAIDDTLWDVRGIMQQQMVNHIVITYAQGALAGIISQSDLLKTIQPTEIYKLVTLLESKMFALEEENQELRRQQIQHQSQTSNDDNPQISNTGLMFRQFAENHRGAIMIRDVASGKLLYVSPAYQTIWRQSSEILYKNPDAWMEFIHPEDIDRVVQAYQQDWQGNCFDEEYRLVLANGQIRWVWGRCFPIKNRQTDTYQIATVIEDISDRKYTEIALDHSEQKLKASESLWIAMFKRSVVGMAITDLKGRFIQTNPFYQEMVGYSEQELAAMSFTDNMLTEDIAENLHLRNLVLTGERDSYQMEKKLVRRDGKVIWVRTTSSIIPDDTGTDPLFIGVIEDIGDRKQAEEALQQLNQELESRVEQRTYELREVNQQLTIQIQERQKLITLVEQSNEELVRTNLELACATRLKDEFLANMSHEFRTPLNAILGMSDGLLNGVFSEVNPMQEKALGVIENSGKHLLELINGILEVAQIGSGKLTLDLSSVMINELCQSSISFVQRMIDQKNIRLYLSIQPELASITIDKRRIQQALINLLNNAIKFTAMGGEVRLDVQVVEIANANLTMDATCSHAIAFAVSDTGIGIAPEDIDKLFQAFVQIDGSYSRRQSGTGLGLILVKQIVKLHQGDVTVASQLGKGSCFTIFLPY